MTLAGLIELHEDWDLWFKSSPHISAMTGFQCGLQQLKHSIQMDSILKIQGTMDSSVCWPPAVGNEAQILNTSLEGSEDGHC